ncbi:UDP-Glc:alpha-D-GlcNAc-diphosphoundecaprenol beta-1,3-glucosyltransferase WfgD [Pseudoalteromonas sp. P1-13-1a]|uniref:Glycosyltransferase n=1 Tax=Pseudoalteromonas undina TaxID=43660 RepID=A0ACC6R211_9GAMM|nr:glycosyltransferase [Pseudoalteromonas sp. P1-13-1a]KPZ52525.1 UDP-Glc:alpha-D-GlcNAc-diphosphoundecaprenol beta-1,3-glucosyltransferase WfgD [Pseudoalteromonas sp. P1-13-1a]
MQTPLITVYMPTHNRLNNLKRAVQSVLDQSYSQWELIIVNDGSSDGTADYLNALALTDPRITVFHHETALGACAARNKAINAASGEFITGLDDDDVFTTDRLTYFMTHWSESYTSLCTPVTVCKGSSKVEHNFFIGELSLDDILVVNKVGNQLFCKTEHLKHIGGFDTSFKAWQDYDTWVRFFKSYGPGLKLPKSTYLQYEVQSDVSITRSPNRLTGFKQFLNKHSLLMNKKQLNAMGCWEAIISGNWVPLSLLIHSHKDIYKYSIMHNMKKILGR